MIKVTLLLILLIFLVFIIFYDTDNLTKHTVFFEDFKIAIVYYLFIIYC